MARSDCIKKFLLCKENFIYQEYVNDLSKMNGESVEPTDDEITKALNERLDEEKKEKALNEAVEKKLEERKSLEVKEAVFTDDTKKDKKTVRIKEDIECATCGSKDMEKISDDADTFIYKKQDITAVYKCNKCGRRSGVLK